MPTIQLPTEFSELLSLLNAHKVKYLVVGGYAVAYHGYLERQAISTFGWSSPKKTL